MGKWMMSGLKILACSLSLLFAVGCNITLGPIVETKTIIVKPGTGIEILDQVTVHAHLLKDGGEKADVFEQDIGGWVAIHPEHWQAVKNKIAQYKEKLQKYEGGHK
jgi:hypothetical protein